MKDDGWRDELKRNILDALLTPTHYTPFSPCLEPTILLIERSVDKYPYITAMMIDFLRLSVDDSFPFLAERIKLHTRSAMKVLIDSNISR